jgi:signal transduction histidine kinase
MSGIFIRFDPRRSLVAAISWLVIALAACFAIAASLWVGSLARDNIVRQHIRRLALESDQLGADLAQALAARRDAIRAAGAIVRAGDGPDADAAPRAVFAELQRSYPQLAWIAMTDIAGRPVAGTAAALTPAWFAPASRGVWLGVIADRNLGDSPQFAPLAGDEPALGDMAALVRDADGRPLGVVAAHLTWRQASAHRRLLREAADASLAAQALALDGDGVVVIGPAQWRGRTWSAEPLRVEPPTEGAGPRFERLPDGRILLVARTPVDAGADSPLRGWQVQLSEPEESVYRRADTLGAQILWISLGLGAATALLGAMGARRLTDRLKRLTDSAVAAGGNEAAHIEVPPGRDEVTKLAAAFAKILDDLRQERSELRALSADLERRVAVRTREVERLAEESRYAAVVRERLKIARDLHDTLAHSMMAMLSELRLLRRMQARNPAALADELARAEQIAQDGLNAARTAITQMRVNTVRDTGLGTALERVFGRFTDQTGVAGEFTAEPAAANVGDERAETIFRIAEEVLRNIERHAHATRVTMTLRMVGETHLELRIDDNGTGFDTQAVEPGHFGIIGLHEQAHLIGAELEVGSVYNSGTTVCLRLRIVPETL